MARQTQNNKASTTNSDRAKPIHYVNFYERDSNIELGYRTIDDLPAQYLTIAQKSEEACDKLFGNQYQRAVYRQAGASKKESILSLEDF